MKRFLLFFLPVLFIVAFSSPPANANLAVDTPIRAGDDPIFQQWVYDALVDTPDAFIASWGTVHAYWTDLPVSGCPSVVGCSWEWPPTIALDAPAGAGRSTFWHELGHEYRWWDMTATESTKFLGYASAADWSGTFVNDQFADSYKRCAGFAQPGSNITGISDAELRDTCQFLRN